MVVVEGSGVAAAMERAGGDRRRGFLGLVADVGCGDCAVRLWAEVEREERSRRQLQQHECAVRRRSACDVSMRCSALAHAEGERSVTGRGEQSAGSCLALARLYCEKAAQPTAALQGLAHLVGGYSSHLSSAARCPAWVSCKR